MHVTTVVVQGIRWVLNLIAITLMQLSMALGKVFNQPNHYSIQEVERMGEKCLRIQCDEGMIAVYVKHKNEEYVQVIISPFIVFIPINAEYRIITKVL